MTVQEIITLIGAGGGGLAVVLMAVIELAPVKVNPWSAIARAIGRAMNADIIKDLADVKKSQAETQKALEEHIREDDERAADSYRERILSFNLELMRNQKHTREDYVDVLAVIDKYHAYCEQHPNYPNSRATHAVANIERVYDERMQKNDFL
ncbi:MAG: hypothetical protein LUE22_06530 [Oscillospiraceae bacterium]|nr:hypothetical protein [Oscillospiraceae bacterium]